jgi:CHC2 zinc finger
MSAAVKVLDRLQGVKATGPGRWLARCPAHEDRSPSLSVRDIDGRVLIHCFGGCGPGDVVAALGLTLGDLFDKPLGPHFAPSKSRIPATDLLEVVDLELLNAAILCNELAQDKRISEADRRTLTTAAVRIGHARDHAHGR